MSTQKGVMEIYHRILAVDWQTTHLDPDFHVKLMLEYIRRSALWYKAIQCSQPARPLRFDVADCIDPTVRADPALLKVLLNHLDQFLIHGSVKQICEEALHWATIRNTTQVQQFSLPDPYEPLLVLFEHGGTFSTEHGFINVAGCTIQTSNWRDYADKPPFVTLEP